MNDTTPTDPTTSHDADDLTTPYETDKTTVDAPRSGFHPVSIGHLVMGVAFAGILLIWGLFITGNADADDLKWLTPMPWLLAGVAGLLAVVLAPRRRARASADSH